MSPTPRAILLLALGILVAVLPAVLGDRFWVAWLAFAAVTVLAVGLDAALAWPRRKPQVLPTAPAVLYVGSADELVIDLGLRHRPRPAAVEAVCELEPPLTPQPPRTTPAADGRCRLRVPLVPSRRGTARVGAVWLRWNGPLGLMRWQTRHALDLEIPVAPDMPGLRRAALRFFGSRDLMTGEKMELHTGDGSEFERMREFVPGLDHRAMDWKASARHRKLLCREFRAERNHQIVIAVDTGHLMSETIDGLPRLDHAIHAGLLLSWLSLRSGDRVGLYAFDKGPGLYVAPQAGLGSFGHLQQASAQLAYSGEETNFTLGLAELAGRLRRRSLVVLLTDFVDTVTAELMVDDLARLSRHHLVVFVALRAPAVDTIAAAAPDGMLDMARALVAADLQRERELVLRRLTRLGVHTIDAVPGAVSPQLLNRYLDIKRRELIA